MCRICAVKFQSNIDILAWGFKMYQRQMYIFTHHRDIFLIFISCKSESDSKMLNYLLLPMIQKRLTL